MRLVLVLVGSFGLSIAGPAFGAPASDPAFVGITMGDLQNGQCRVGEIETGSAAEAAHLLAGDVIVSFDGQPITATSSRGACEALTAAITSHNVGDVVRMQVVRDTEVATLSITLSTRSELLKHRLLDKPIGPVEVVDGDYPERTTPLDTAKISIVGWYYPDKCIACGPAFEHVADRANKALHHEVPVIAAARATPEQIDNMRIGADPSRDGIAKKLVTALGVDHGAPPGVRSVAVVPAPDGHSLDRLTFADDRIYFTVIDSYGIVRFVAPASPEADDVDAVLDEIIAAAEHCERAGVGHR